ncbi:MAG: hypothetical protein Unbinned2350contig1001_32 [Prokaryotic dsDNA virus sp.]|jgi:hypothetical protein|nr:MAG: hypothetical protein Unbinned2350contig1001_32 [Prokaryotic dsDNA virus sp.]|tara:strand:+ start:586 stop:780 length:195 start_codon:yes stop_codon:yes gene_type:complete
MEEHLKIIPFKEPELTEEQLQELKEKEKKVKEECAKNKKRDANGLKPRHHKHIWNHIKQTTGRN